jgi:hypothetical protein
MLERILEGARLLGYAFLHHGDCMGIDEQADELAKAIGYRTICHPPSDPRHRADTEGHHYMHNPRPYLARNHDIVEAVEVLLAFPGESVEVLRSGTWATVRWARRVHKTCMIVLPSGLVRVEDNNDRVPEVPEV